MRNQRQEEQELSFQDEMRLHLRYDDLKRANCMKIFYLVFEIIFIAVVTIWIILNTIRGDIALMRFAAGIWIVTATGWFFWGMARLKEATRRYNEIYEDIKRDVSNQRNQRV